MPTEQKLVPTWIYSASGESKIVELPLGAPPPSSWAFSPADFKKAETKPAVKPVTKTAAKTSAYETKKATKSDDVHSK